LPPAPRLDLIGSLRAPVADAAGLAERVAAMEARLADHPTDTGARVVLAEVLLRQARVTGTAAHAARAEHLLREALREDPGAYDAQRLLGAALLSLHRFEAAIAAAERAQAVRPDDPWNHGVIGDGLLELGRYDEAFHAYQRMMDARPGAASYARAAHALELQGSLEGALETMRRAADATSPRDAEGLAWAKVQVGDLLFRLGRLDEADLEYRIAGRVFPGHPDVVMARARLAAARGRDDQALELLAPLLEHSPTLAAAALAGDLHLRAGRAAEAERQYAMAEAIGRESAADASLAVFLADRGRRLDEAVTLAERAAGRQQDIRTLDALAWAYLRAGRVEEARAASDRALRTGTRERSIVLHAAAIAAARGRPAEARALEERAAPRGFDVDRPTLDASARGSGDREGVTQ
jgi:tetratricopeptide (TPR) repeat protein